MPQNKLQIKDKETLRFYPLEQLGDCLSIEMHNRGQKIKFYGKYDYVPCGTWKELDCPFCRHPDQNVRRKQPIRFMIVNTISNSNLSLNDKVCYVELKLSIYNQLNNYQIQNKRNCYLRPVAINRRGSGAEDTTYQVAISEYNPQKEITEDGVKMIKILRDEIEEYYSGIALDIRNIFKSALINGEVPENREVPDGTEF